MKEISERTEFVANLSIPTLDEKRLAGDRAAHAAPAQADRGARRARPRRDRDGVLVAPLIPGVNDCPQQVEELLGLIGEAGAGSVGGIGLHLRGEVRGIWFDWLRQYRPDLVAHYEELFAGRLHAKAEPERLGGSRVAEAPDRDGSWPRKADRTSPAVPAPPPRHAGRRLF